MQVSSPEIPAPLPSRGTECPAPAGCACLAALIPQHRKHQHCSSSPATSALPNRARCKTSVKGSHQKSTPNLLFRASVPVPSLLQGQYTVHKLQYTAIPGRVKIRTILYPHSVSENEDTDGQPFSITVLAS